MIHMGKNILLSLMLLMSGPVISAENVSELGAKALAKSLEARFEACKGREVVAEFNRKHHKHVWQKQSWAPPADVIADVKSNDSILYPYIITIEFSLTFNSGPERESQEDAEKDANLSQFAPPGMPLRSVKNRNVYWADRSRSHQSPTGAWHKRRLGRSTFLAGRLLGSDQLPGTKRRLI